MSGKRFLLVTSRPPWPPTSGGAQRTHLLYSSLCRLGQVDLVLVDFRISRELVAMLKTQFNLIGYFPPPLRDANCTAKRRGWTASPVRRLQLLWKTMAAKRRASRWTGRQIAAGDYHLVVVRHVKAAAYAGLLRWRPLVIDIDDLEHARYLSKFPGKPDNPLKFLAVRFRGRLIAARMRMRTRRCEHLWINRSEDAESLPHERFSLLPNIPFAGQSGDQAPTPASRARSLLFVGHLGYQINVRAIDHFISELWPEILAQCPPAVVVIAGSGGDPVKLARWSGVPGVSAVGEVDDLGAVYAASRFAICPISQGAGTKIKVLEALSHHRTCVVTAHSHRGFEDTLLDGESLLVARSDGEFIQHCIRLLEDDQLCSRLAEVGAACVRRHFSEEVFHRIVEETLAAVVETDRTVRPRRA